MEPLLQRICPGFVNMGRCSRRGCKLRHHSENLKEERRAWVEARLMNRKQLARESGDPIDPHDKASNAQRAAVFADWLVQRFGKEKLSMGSGVLDVAGGRGALSWELSFKGVPCTLIDERRAPALDRRQRKQLKEVGTGRCAPVMSPEASGRRGVQMADSPDAGHSNASAASSSEQLPLPFAHLQQRFDPDFELEHGELLDGVSMIVGMHPDEATEVIIDTALRLRKPFAVVPCCVFARAIPKFLPQRRQVTTYEQLLDYLELKHSLIQRTHLPFFGRNAVLFWAPSDERKKREVRDETVDGGLEGCTDTTTAPSLLVCDSCLDAEAI